MVNKSTSESFLKSNRGMMTLTAVYVVFLLILPVALPFGTAKWFLSETGPVEILSIVAWLVLAAQFAFSSFRPFVKWPMAMLFALFSAREADLHKTFTTQGMLKINYYTKSPAPISEKLVAGVIAIIIITVLLYGAFLFVRFLLIRSGWRTPAGLWLAFAGFLLCVAKVFDRFPNVMLESYGISLPPLLNLYFSSLEEGLELWVPIILIWLASARKNEFAAFE